MEVEESLPYFSEVSAVAAAISVLSAEVAEASEVSAVAAAISVLSAEVAEVSEVSAGGVSAVAEPVEAGKR